ncbi:MAG: dTMP kinase [Candidatus Omnitrophica bacterium]|nr:dTMP kinase [Candidatus Omnitrophota bacterium]
MKGKFITFEGSECSGKSTQSKLLYEYLLEKKYKVVFLREPGGTKVSEAIRDILLDNRNKSITRETELLLYMASRSQTVSEVIRPALEAGKIVVCDRFLDSTLVYQGYGLGIDIKLIKSLGRFVTDGVNPDLTILLDLPLEKALNGIHREKDRIENRSFQYHRKVKNGYLKLARQEPKRIKIVKLVENKFVTQKKIRELVGKIL